MKKQMIGIMTGAMLFTMVSGTAVMAAEITADDAVNTALEKAGVTAEQVAVYKKVWEFSDGREKFDIDFLIPGQTKFDYDIDALTGEVLIGETDMWEPEDDYEYQGLTVGEAADPDEASKIDAAIQTALKDAGVAEGDAIIYKRGTNYEFGKKIFDINFFIAGQTKYDYDIDAATGEILTREQDMWEPEDDLEYKGLISPEAAQNAAPAPGEIADADAAAIAIKDAGFNEADVTVLGCYRELDDGVEQYKVSFRTADGMVYEYNISLNGTIIEKDMDYGDD